FSSFGCGGETQALRLVAAVYYRFPPRPVLEIPLHSLHQAGLQRFAGPPPEFSLDLTWIDGVPPVVPRAVRHKFDQRSVTNTILRMEFIEQIADRFHQILVGSL